jgi:hypothetical protein
LNPDTPDRVSLHSFKITQGISFIVVPIALSEDLDASLKTAARAFDDRFEKVLLLQQKGFQKKQIDFAKMLLSNLIGGTG